MYSSFIYRDTNNGAVDRRFKQMQRASIFDRQNTLESEEAETTEFNTAPTLRVGALLPAVGAPNQKSYLIQF